MNRFEAPLLVALVSAVAVLALLMPSGEAPRLALLGPITYFAAVVGDAATAAILLMTWRYSLQQRSTLVLALSFASGAVLLFFAMLVLPLMPQAPAVLGAPHVAGLWLFFAWNVISAVGPLLYVAFRHDDSTARPTGRFSILASGIAVCVTSAITIAALGFADRLPALADGAPLQRLIALGVAPVAIGLLAFAALVVFRMRDKTSTDRALGYSLYTLTLAVAILVFDGVRYGPTSYAGRLLLVFGTSLVLLSALRTLLEARMELQQMQWALKNVEGEASRHAARIRAVWQIASQADDSDERRFVNILEIASAALRPGIPIFGVVSHLEGDDLIMDAAAWGCTDDPELHLLEHTPPMHTRIAFRRTLQSLLGTDPDAATYWDDLTGLTNRGLLFEEYGWRSFIGTPVIIARATHYLTFASPHLMMDRPFAEDDIAYVDVVAAFFANRFMQLQQFERIQFQIEHDALTGLENRVQFRKAVRDEIRSGLPFTIAFVDLDGFRHINEREGSQIGDEVLVEVASSLARASAENLVARMSADEFGIVLRGDGTLEQAAVGIGRYANCFIDPFHTGDRNGTQVLGIGASIGAARFPVDGDSAETLMRKADVALTVAKARGGSATMIFDEPMSGLLEESRVRVVELADAISHDQLALDYQPTFDLATRAIGAAEALVRWDHPKRGRLLPAEFIDFAERNGMIGEISRWVFRSVVRDLTSVPALPAGFRIYFNLAAQMLDDVPFIAEVSKALHEAPMLVDHLGIEVTETAAMQNVERSMNTIDLFRRWGLSIAIDDFGTGYSSLSYLKHLTVDVIKIDRSFVMGLPGDERDAAVTEMLLRITDRFGFATLAEGIETEAQAKWLLDHGCRFGQGFLIARPHSFEEMLERLGVLRAV